MVNVFLNAIKRRTLINRARMPEKNPNNCRKISISRHRKDHRGKHLKDLCLSGKKIECTPKCPSYWGAGKFIYCRISWFDLAYTMQFQRGYTLSLSVLNKGCISFVGEGKNGGIILKKSEKVNRENTGDFLFKICFFCSKNGYSLSKEHLLCKRLTDNFSSFART